MNRNWAVSNNENLLEHYSAGYVGDKFMFLPQIYVTNL